jgi:threonine/homoserine/homoserine lactone efflux protein
MTDPWLFALAVAAVLATPGPTNTLLMTSGATVGIYRSLSLLLAEGLGYAISVLALGALLGPLVRSMPHAREALSVAAGAWLCWMAFALWRTGIREQDRVVSWRQVFVTTLLNPKVLVFAFVIVPFDAPNVALYCAGFYAILLPAAASWIAFGALARRSVRARSLALIPRVAAVVLAGFAVALISSLWLS